MARTKQWSLHKALKEKKKPYHYDGETNKEKEPHGKGVKYGKDGFVIYNGEWKNGMRHGCGIEYDGTKFFRRTYEGNFADDNYNGYGTSYNVDVIDYAGEWNAGKKHGYGEQYLCGDKLEFLWEYY